MAFSSAQDLLQWLGANQFLPPPQVEELRAQLPQFPDAHALAKELIRRNWLTPFQANQILLDKAETLVVGPYRFLERIGEGAMGQVFKAWNVRLGMFVAVKMIHKELMTSAKAKERFRREMETASQLDHPNIVLVRDAGDVDGRPYMVMDFVDGSTLTRLVRSSGPLAIPEACLYLYQAALGLQQAFERGVVHRDIKPGNLMVSRTGPHDPPLVRVMDFGLARMLTDRDAARLTQMGNILGTVDYISPEQAENAHEVDTRSDIYSLGCTLFYLLTARPPFPGGSIVEKVSARLSGAIPNVRMFRPEVPPPLEAILLHMIARKPEHRFATPQEVAHALLPFVGVVPQPIFAPAAGPLAGMPPAPMPFPPPPSSFENDPFRFEDAVAEAAPVTQPFQEAGPAVATVASPPMALPVAAALNQAPLATPVLANPVLASPVASPATPAPAAKPVSPRKAWPIYLIVVGTLLTLVLLIVAAVGVASFLTRRDGPKLAYPGGSLSIVADDPQMKVAWGQKRRFIVKIDRKNFKGPVTLNLKNLPEGLKAEPRQADANTSAIEIFVNASYGSTLGEFPAAIVGEARELKAETPVTIRVSKQ